MRDSIDSIRVNFDPSFPNQGSKMEAILKGLTPVHACGIGRMFYNEVVINDMRRIDLGNHTKTVADTSVVTVDKTSAASPMIDIIRHPDSLSFSFRMKSNDTLYTLKYDISIFVEWMEENHLNDLIKIDDIYEFTHNVFKFLKYYTLRKFKIGESYWA